MDVKAMSRSKRSHTQQHQPKKPHRPKTLTNPNSSASTSASSNDPKMAKKEAREKKRTTQSSLSSNWDRYDEVPEEGEGDGVLGSDSEDPSPSSSGSRKAKDDVVKPKSKGADYEYLVSEAKSRLLLSSRYPSFDDCLPDICQGLGPLLAVRGENIASLIGADNFLDDETAPVQEVPFFSLNLHALAEQLAEIPLAERLFIKDDLLPPEVWDLETKKGEHQLPVQTPTATAEFSDELTGASEVAEDMSEVSPSDTDGNHSVPASSVQLPKSLQKVSVSEGDILQGINTQAVTQNQRLPRFHTTDVEAELDMLLDSFRETKISDPFTIHRGGTIASPEEATSTCASVVSKGKSPHNMVPFRPPADRGSCGPALPSINLNNSIDDLLKETTDMTLEDATSPSSLVKSTSSDDPPVPSSSLPGPSSKVALEDFDSWFDTL